MDRAKPSSRLTYETTPGKLEQYLEGVGVWVTSGEECIENRKLGLRWVSQCRNLAKRCESRIAGNSKERDLKNFRAQMLMPFPLKS